MIPRVEAFSVKISMRDLIPISSLCYNRPTDKQEKKCVKWHSLRVRGGDVKNKIITIKYDENTHKFLAFGFQINAGEEQTTPNSLN